VGSLQEMDTFLGIYDLSNWANKIQAT
jgi:hypothetical protein